MSIFFPVFLVARGLLFSGFFSLGELLELNVSSDSLRPGGHSLAETWEPGTWLMHGWREPVKERTRCPPNP